MLTVLVLLLAVASVTAMEGFIVGGKEVSIRQWPFITFIEAIGPDKRTSACGGSLLSSQTVLTAAHCLDDITEKKKLFPLCEYTIHMGDSAFSKSRITRRVQDYETHHSYDPAKEDVKGDVGVMFLYSPVKFIENVKKVILFKNQFDEKRDKRLMVAGWGRFDMSEEVRISPRLKDAKLTSISLSDCKRRHPYIHDISSVVCAEASKDFAYSGDSGGPMVKPNSRREQLGIVSFRNEETGVTIFTSVPKYYHWINETNLRLYRKHCHREIH